MNRRHRQALLVLAGTLLTTAPRGQDSDGPRPNFYRGLLAEVLDHKYPRARQEYELCAGSRSSGSQEIALARLMELDRIQALNSEYSRHAKRLREITKLDFSKERRNRQDLRLALRAALKQGSAAGEEEAVKIRTKLARSQQVHRPITFRVIRHLDAKANTAKRSKTVPAAAYGSKMRSLRRMAAVVADRYLDGKKKSADELTRLLRRSSGRFLTPPKLSTKAPARKTVRRALAAMDKYLSDQNLPVYERQVVNRLKQHIRSLAQTKRYSDALGFLQRLPYYDRRFLRTN